MNTFPYQKNSTGGFFPVIDIVVSYKKQAARIFTLVDSGATISIFREDVADQLNLEIEKGKQIFLGGVGGRIKGYVHELNTEAAGKKFVMPVVFSYEYLVSFNLIGRQVFFEEFKITFDEKKKWVRLE